MKKGKEFIFNKFTMSFVVVIALLCYFTCPASGKSIFPKVESQSYYPAEFAEHLEELDDIFRESRDQLLSRAFIEDSSDGTKRLL